MEVAMVKLSQIILEDLSACTRDIQETAQGSAEQNWALTRLLFLHASLPLVCFMEEAEEPVVPNDILTLAGLHSLLARMGSKHGPSFALISSAMKNAMALIPGYAAGSATQPLSVAEFYSRISSKMRNLSAASN